jgi:putative aldouronate transport system substrate-binding protein
MRKRRFLKVLALVLALTQVMTFMACGSSGTPKQSAVSTAGGEAGQTESEKTEAAESDLYAPDPDKTYEINIIANTNWPVDNNGDLLARWNEKFNVKINVTNLDFSNAGELLNLQIAGDNIPDVFTVNAVTYNNYYEQGVLAEIPEDMLQKYMPLCMSELEAEAPGITSNYGFVDEKRYGLPNSIFYYNNYRTPIIYNGLWMDQVGVSKVPETLDELEALLYKFAKEDPDGDGQNNTYGLSSSSMSAVYGAYGVETDMWVERDGKAVYAATLPEMKEALTKLNDWYNRGILDPQFITGENTGGYWALTQAFINGQIGMTSMGNFYHWSPELPGRGEGANLTEIKAAKPDLADKLIWGKPVKGPNGEGSIKKASSVTDSYLVFGKQLENEPDKMAKIMEMIDYLNGTCTDDTYLSAFYGEKGTDWDYNEDGSLKFVANETELRTRGAWGTLQFIALGRNNSYPEAALVKWAEERGLDQGGKETLLSSLVTMESKVLYGTDLDKLRDTAIVSIITGDEPISYFDEFVKRWYNEGGQEITDEVNEWYGAVKQ